MYNDFKADFSLLALENIPEIDLYVDQVISILSFYLPASRPLTKAMINNYSKEGLISEVKGKRYNKQQIIQIYLICIMKEVLSMQEIRSIMQCFASVCSWEYIYEQFYETRMNNYLMPSVNCDKAPDEGNLQTAQRILLLASVAGDMKLAVSGLVDKTFPQKNNKK